MVALTGDVLGGKRIDLVEVRRQEVQFAAELLGLNSLQGWSEPDRSLEHSTGLPEKIAATIENLKPASVFPDPMEIRPDHRTAGFAVSAALQRVYRVGLKPDIIAYEIGVQNPINFCIDITEDKIQKEAVMAVYASQNNENNYPELVTAPDKGRMLSLAPEVGYSKEFFCFSERDLQISLQEMTHHIINHYQQATGPLGLKFASVENFYPVELSGQRNSPADLTNRWFDFFSNIGTA